MPTDIIVTTPKRCRKQAAREAEQIKEWGSGYYYRDYTQQPPVKRGSRVYYVEAGYVKGFAEVVRVDCSDGHRYRMLMNAATWQWIVPIPMRGFQGWRYMKIAQQDVVIIGDWQDPMPAVQGEVMVA